MKKTLLFAAAVLAFISCRKEDFTTQDGNNSPVFTATIANPVTKTVIDTDPESPVKGKISWESDDTITIFAIKNADTVCAVYEVVKIEGGKATFNKKEGQPDLPTGVNYFAIFGKAPAKTQDYNDYYSEEKKAKDLYMTSGEAKPGTDLTFTAACGLLKLNLTAEGAVSDKSICRIEVSGRPAEGVRTTFTLSCDSVDISSAKEFYLALPAGQYDHIVCFNSNKDEQQIYEVNNTKDGGMAVELNKVQPVTLLAVVFRGPAKNVFTVASSGTYTKVAFTKGNLYWGGNDLQYRLEANQYDYRTWYNNQCCINGEVKTGGTELDHTGLFYWTKSGDESSYPPHQAKYDITGTPQGADYFFCGYENKANFRVYIDGKEVKDSLFALSGIEWNQLILRSGKYAYGVTLMVAASAPAWLKNNMVIAPDGYVGFSSSRVEYTDEEWKTAEKAGLICLPPVGYRSYSGSSTTVTEVGEFGHYWSSRSYDTDARYSYEMKFGTTEMTWGLRSGGYAIRLVSVVPE